MFTVAHIFKKIPAITAVAFFALALLSMPISFAKPIEHVGFLTLAMPTVSYAEAVAIPPPSAAAAAQNSSSAGGSTTGFLGWAGGVVDWFSGTALLALATVLVSLLEWLVVLSGMLFDFALNWTALKFTATLTAGTPNIMQGIQIVWTTFRDMSNIVIIGMFVFIAIATILGSDEYGYKKHIARLLVVAVLINFSLFFVEFTIDVSTIFSSTFYSEITGTSTATASQDTSSISTAFQQRIGVSGLYGDYMKVYGAYQGGKKSLTVLTAEYLIVNVVFIIVVSAVFLYGAFLLVSRGIMFIFLMLASPLAFASLLIPKFKDHEYGWKGWLDGLLKNAALAPVLMLFLWASLKVIPGGPSSSITDFILTPSVGDFAGLIVPFVAIGLLYLSIVLSKNLASGISGFSIAATIPAFAAIGGSRIVGALGRGTIGKAASERFASLKAKGYGDTAMGRTILRGLDSIRTSSFDASRAKPVKGTLESIAGLKLKSEIGKGGFVGSMKAQAEKATKDAHKFGISKDDQKKVVEAAINDSKKAQDDQRTTISTEKAPHEEALNKAMKKKEEIMKEREREIRMAEQQVGSAKTPAEETAARANLTAARNHGQPSLDAEEARITAAQKKIAEADNLIKKLDAEATAVGAKVEKRLDGAVEDKLAATIAFTRPGTLFGLIGKKENDAAVKMIGGIIKEQKGKKSLQDALKDIVATGTPPAAAGGPAASDGGH